jgi:hypothetical protein
MKNRSIIILFLLLGLNAQAQQQKYEYLNQLWGGYFNSVKVNSKFSINTDLQGRTTDWYKQWAVALIRTGVSFKATEKITLSGGFADFISFQKDNKVSRNEYRPWVEFAVSDACDNVKINHKLKVERREFQSVMNDELVNKYTSNYRFRYRFDVLIPIWKKAESEKALSFQFGNELMINAGKSIVNNYFDQNRTWGAFLYTVNRKLSLQLMYMNIYQQLSGGTTLDQINVIRFTIYHTITL